MEMTMRIPSQNTLIQNIQNISNNQKKQNTQLKLAEESRSDNCSLERARELRARIRKIDAQKYEVKNNVFTGVAQGKEDGFWNKTSSTEEDEDTELDVDVKYNYKEVASQIQRAKTSLSAGRALLSARRKVLEVRRKIASKNGDAKELQLALTHAKRMEMVARKKKHHLELEELVSNTQKRDKREEEAEDRISEVKETVIEGSEDKLVKSEDEIFKAREEYFDKRVEELKESGTEITDDMLAELNEEVAELGEETLKQLEETLQMLEEMEIVDPHMSEEDLEKLKIKHRKSENKDLVKADMDYLKSLIKYQMEQQKSVGMPMASPVGATVDFSVPMDAQINIEFDSPAVDIQV